MVGLRFHEVMIGRIGPQHASPGPGYGYPGAVAASLHVRIDIDDLDLFLDPTLPNEGRLTVELHVPVFSGRPFVGHGNGFELFRPANIPSGGPGYLMVYEAEVTDLDRTYEMAAYKYLEPRRLWKFWRLWPETTTLHVTLTDITETEDPKDVDVELPEIDPVPPWLQTKRNEVGDEPWANRDYHRPAYAAGIVRLNLGRFARQIASMTPIGAPWYAKPFVVLRFGMFFAGSLFRIYVLGQTETPA